MSRESESEQTQRTVAELLAQYGGGSGEVSPRRRRRRAEDTSDTAPQAIIDRVNSDSGRLLPVRDDDPPPTGRRAAPDQTAYTPPVTPEPFARPAEPPFEARREPVEPPFEGRREPVEPPFEGRRGRASRSAEPFASAEGRAEPFAPAEGRAEPFAEGRGSRTAEPFVEGRGPRSAEPFAEGRAARPAPPAVEPPFTPEPPRSRLDAAFTRTPPRRGVPAPTEAEETRQVPPIVDDYADDYPEPPRPTPPGLDATRLTPPADPARLAPTEVARPVPPEAPRPVPPKPEGNRAALPRSVPPPPPPARDPVTEVLPRIADKLTPNVPLESLPTESVLIVPPAPAPMPDPLPDQTAEDWFGDDSGEMPRVEPESTQFHPYVDLDEEDDDDFRPAGAEDEEEPAGLADVDADEEAADRSPGREWLVMIGQLAVGVLGGAALWLGFNFLWRTLAPAALVVALAVTVGLVLLVRRIRRADDLQTTVLAVLVGLIVTVSPAAMLLVKS
ncbi:hypothetical protein [Saccharothrix variisporea]|uniref:Uncharacterized protein n=1 Tax=Saccharothrix variisporea TaxID=543527 RepID=A0A495XD77_9PSEU|nr:hypothetical protein [Saccharothrix variisporea]RKT71947.1 hypothetical protein DFJ66_5249 [Saccharothrix variisporea]